jgi:hypothetical protein
MATFSSNLCPWTTTGDSACNVEQFIDIDAGGARLGQSCAKEDCIEGTCFRAKDEKDGTCRRVLFPGDKGCDRANYVCTTGLQCYDDVCLQTLPGKQTSSTSTAQAPDNSIKTYTYVLYGFIAIMLILFIIMMVSMATTTPQNVSF